jgi:DNA-binding transcriptional ArsR family regulator
MSPARRPGSPRGRDPALLFAALGDETRLGLVARLSAHGPESATRLGARARVSRQAIEKHLAVLARAGIARGLRRGRERIWSLDPERLAEARAYLDAVSRQWDLALGRLKAFVEQP